MSTNEARNSLVIILHEIYGVNDHINFFGEVMNKEGFDVLIPNLLHRESYSYDQEEAAYQYFMNEIGFNKSLEVVLQTIKSNREKYNKIYIIGFSIGATIAWISSEYGVDAIVGFYGSRIRKYIEIEPRCPALLFFSRHENSFDVLDLERNLRDKKDTKIEIIEAEHGFMNPFYKNYNSSEYHACVKKSMEFLRQVEERKK